MSDLPTAAPAAARRGMVAWLTRPSGKLLLLGGSLAVALGFLIWTATQGAAVYYYTVAELRAMGSSAYDRVIRVNGQVVEGSIATASGGETVQFRIHDTSGELPVAFRGTPPDLFGYATEDRYQDVIVEGQLRPSGTFQARNLIVKHGPQFEPRQIPAQ